MALVVAEHCHNLVADGLAGHLGERVAKHHRVAFAGLAESLMHVLDGREQPIMQLDRVQLPRCRDYHGQPPRGILDDCERDGSSSAMGILARVQWNELSSALLQIAPFSAQYYLFAKLELPLVLPIRQRPWLRGPCSVRSRVGKIGAAHLSNCGRPQTLFVWAGE